LFAGEQLETSTSGEGMACFLDLSDHYAHPRPIDAVAVIALVAFELLAVP
jgi:hypothetical protein